MKRGDLITVAMQGDFGKPRPALVMQVDRFAELPTLTALPVSSALQDAPLLRVTVQPTAENGLKNPRTSWWTKQQLSCATRREQCLAAWTHKP